jgi:DNA-binding NtrC family response regulator
VPQLDGEEHELLRPHDWPGNVREHETVILRSVVNLSGSETIRARDVEPFLAARTRALFDRDLLESNALHDLKLRLEREYLTNLFYRTRGNGRKMMESLGVKRTQLYAWFQRLGIDVRELRKRL